MNLWSDFLTNEQRLIHKWTHYFPAYERHFARFCNQSIKMLEIGCGEGGSLQMWKRYLGPSAQIVGIDILETCKDYEEDQIAVRIGSQADTTFLASLNDEFGPFDIVLDDGSHRMDHVLATFEYLYPTIVRNGVYMIEDLHTAYRAKFGGGLGVKASFMEVTKRLIDELHADWTQGAVAETPFTRMTMSIHVYDSIVAFERGFHRKAVVMKTGGQP